MPGTGLETPDTIDLRKKTADRPLYQVLEEKEASVGGALMGSSHTYVIPGAAASSRAVDKLPAAVGAGVAKAKADVSVTLRPEELEGLDEDAIKAKYEVGGDTTSPRQVCVDEERWRRWKAVRFTGSMCKGSCALLTCSTLLLGADPPHLRD